ncbi:MAG: hypothetical protein SPLUMA1_SPLUMAMAG1_00327 [uncultured Sulfurimonas sp.]|nr:MAG: hypothetical protein SPLUMA1_SPLUMAMAG1_00327 [uncultured Sulfurimonas sp.]
MKIQRVPFKKYYVILNIPQNVRTNIEIYLSKVTKVQKKSFAYANTSANINDIGDGVNLASRLESLCIVYKVRHIISEYTKEQLKGTYAIQ